MIDSVPVRLARHEDQGRGVAGKGTKTGPKIAGNKKRFQ
jgi:hypothetical protein